MVSNRLRSREKKIDDAFYNFLGIFHKDGNFYGDSKGNIYKREEKLRGRRMIDGEVWSRESRFIGMRAIQNSNYVPA